MPPFFFLRHPRLIESGQRKAGITRSCPVGELRARYIIANVLTLFPVADIVGAVLLMVWLYKTVNEVDRVWNEGIFPEVAPAQRWVPVGASVGYSIGARTVNTAPCATPLR